MDGWCAETKYFVAVGVKVQDNGAEGSVCRGDRVKFWEVQMAQSMPSDEICLEPGRGKCGLGILVLITVLQVVRDWVVYFQVDIREQESEVQDEHVTHRCCRCHSSGHVSGCFDTNNETQDSLVFKIQGIRD